jgi:hypothetical protein
MSSSVPRRFSHWWHWGSPEGWKGATGLTHTDCGGAISEQVGNPTEGEVKRVCCKCKKRWRLDWAEETDAL